MMGRLLNTIILIFTLVLLSSCGKDPVVIPQKNPGFIQLLTNLNYNGDQIFVSGKVEQNQLILLDLTGFLFAINGSGNLYPNGGLLFISSEIPQDITPAENRSFLVIPDIRGKHLIFFDNAAYDQYGAYDSRDIFLGPGGNPNHLLGGVENYNPAHEIGALNYDNGFLFPATCTGHYNRINFVFFTMLGSFLLEPQQNNYIHPDTPSYHTILLPDEGDTLVNRVESFNKNFLVSTQKFSYLIHPDGTFKQIFNRSVQEFFQFNSLTYADLGDAVYSSPDDGESWVLVKSNLKNPGFRQFFKVKDSLYFFRKDSLFSVHPDFSWKALCNSGIQGDEITSVNEFIDNVYVTTLSGLFYKKSEDLRK
jgi:hypothetical protein